MKIESVKIKDVKTFNAQYKAAIKEIETEVNGDRLKNNKNFDKIRNDIAVLKKKKVENADSKFFQMEKIIETLLSANVIDLKIKKAVSELNKL